MTLDRDALRDLQDRWLSVPAVQSHVQRHGEAERIAGPGSPTFADVRRFVLPAWEAWFRDFLEERSC